MKLHSKISALGAVLVLTTAFASADSYQFGSYGTSALNQGNQNTAMAFVPGLSTTGSGVPITTTTVNISPGSVWSGALTGSSSWISYGQTGPTTPQGSQPGGNYAPNGDYFFTSSFNLNAAATAFTFNILADDTVFVYLDGNTSNALFMMAPGGNTICQNNLPNCLNVDSINSLTNPEILPFLTAGSHTLTFDVRQIASIDLGVDWTATVTTGSPVPEPGTLLLLGTGLIGSAGALFRKMRM